MSSTDGYFIVKSDGSVTKAQVTGTVLGATGNGPASSGNGSGVWTIDGYFIVKSNGSVTKGDIPLPEAPEFTGTPVTLTGGKLADSTSKEVYDLEAIIGERVLGATGLYPASSSYGSGVWTTDGYYIVNSNGTATKATGIDGNTLGATGFYPASSSPSLCR